MPIILSISFLYLSPFFPFLLVVYPPPLLLTDSNDEKSFTSYQWKYKTAVCLISVILNNIDGCAMLFFVLFVNLCDQICTNTAILQIRAKYDLQLNFVGNAENKTNHTYHRDCLFLPPVGWFSKPPFIVLSVEKNETTGVEQTGRLNDGKISDFYLWVFLPFNPSTKIYLMFAPLLTYTPLISVPISAAEIRESAGFFLCYLRYVGSIYAAGTINLMTLAEVKRYSNSCDRYSTSARALAPHFRSHWMEKKNVRR